MKKIKESFYIGNKTKSYSNLKHEIYLYTKEYFNSFLTKNNTSINITTENEDTLEKISPYNPYHPHLNIEVIIEDFSTIFKLKRFNIVSDYTKKTTTDLRKNIFTIDTILELLTEY